MSNFQSWVPPPKPLISPFVDSILFAISIMAISILPFAAMRPSRRVLLKQISLLRDDMVSLRIALVKDRHGLIGREEGERRYRELQDAITLRIRKLGSAAEENIYRTKGNMTRMLSLHPHQATIDFCIHDIDFLRELVKDYSRGRLVKWLVLSCLEHFLTDSCRRIRTCAEVRDRELALPVPGV